MVQRKFAYLFLTVLFSLTLISCGGGTQSAIATGIAQTQQISQLQTQAAIGPLVVTATPEGTLAATADTNGQQVVTTQRDVNMRAGDSTAYGVMTVIPGGETIQVIGINAAATWYQVLYHNAVGWVSADLANGEVANLPVVTPSAQPQSSGGGGGGGDQDYTFTLDISNDGESQTVSGELTPGDTDHVTVKFEGFGGSVDYSHLRVQLYCSAGEDEVELSESIPRSNHSNECNGDWDYQIEAGDSQLVIGMKLPSSFGGNVSWTMTVEVNL